MLAKTLEVGKVYSSRFGNMIITRKDGNFIYAKNVKYNGEIDDNERILIDFIDYRKVEKTIKFNEIKETTMEQIKNQYLALA